MPRPAGAPPRRAALVTLGCGRNEVDSEELAGRLAAGGWDLADPDDAYYDFDPSWGDGQAAFMDDGSGNVWSIAFTAAGAFIRVFDHESEMSPYAHPDHRLWPGLLDGLPEEFHPQVAEPAFSDGDGQLLATAVLWRRTTDDRWHTGVVETEEDDGSFMLDILGDDIVEEYTDFAGDYYETDVDADAVRHVVELRPLTDAVVRRLNPDADPAAVRKALAEIGYPIA